MRYLIHIGYEGTNYHGWQRQQNTRKTVQEAIEKVLRRIFKKQIAIHGCGRTDTGVHASQYAFQVDLDAATDFDLKVRLNQNFPEDIAVFEVVEIGEEHHVQYHAVARTYDYFVHWKEDPILSRYSTFYPYYALDFDLMQQAVALIRSTQNFRALCKQPDLYDTTWCQLSRCELVVNEAEGRLRFTITSNRFLRGMVRYCVFFLLEVGSGKMSLSEFEQILTRKKEYNKKRPAAPNGLFLSKIEYPFVELDDAHVVIKMLKKDLA